MSNPDEVKNILTSNSSWGLTSSIQRIITDWMMQILVPWIGACFDKYPESFFHAKMATGFNFIEDWKTNHGDKYAAIMGKARKLKRFIKIDENDIMRRIEILLTKKGWKLYPSEREAIIKQIQEFKKEIYG